MAATPDAGTSMSTIQQELQLAIDNRREEQSGYEIFKVGKREREMKRDIECFQHELISLGLYGRSGNGSSIPPSDGDHFRLEIVCRLLEELGFKPVEDWHKICNKIVQDPETIRTLYDEEGSDLVEMEDVQNVLTLDALFLACCLGTYFHPTLGSMFPPLYEILQGKGASFCNLLFVDILKLENQIPLSLIERALEFMILHHGGKQAVRTTGHETIVRFDVTGNVPITSVDVPRVLELICKYFAFHHSSSLPFEWLGRRKNVRKKRLYAFHDEFQDEFRFQYSAHLLDSLYGCTREELLSHFGDIADDYTGWVGTVKFRLTDWAESWFHRWITFQDSVKICFSPLIAQVKRRWSRCTRSIFGSKGPYWEIDWEIDSKKHIFSKIGGSLPSATKLHEAGINCRGQSSVTEDKIVEFKRSLFKATLFLPTITNVGSESELLWRNLVAYENGRFGPDILMSYILMSYFHFMDMLINTEKDVILLTMGNDEKVILLTMGNYPVINRNSLGNEKAMAHLYNSMLANYSYDFSRLPNYRDDFPILDGFPDRYRHWRWDMYRSYRVDEARYIRFKIYRNYVTKWGAITKAIHDFCNNKTTQKLVEFRRTYLNKPWLIISILAATTLLVLAAFQTSYSILSYVHRRDN